MNQFLYTFVSSLNDGKWFQFGFRIKQQAYKTDVLLLNRYLKNIKLFRAKEY